MDGDSPVVDNGQPSQGALSLNVSSPLEELYSIRMCVCEVAKMS